MATARAAMKVLSKISSAAKRFGSWIRNKLGDRFSRWFGNKVRKSAIPDQLPDTLEEKLVLQAAKNNGGREAMQTADLADLPRLEAVHEPGE